MRRIVRLDLALLILLWSVGYSLFIFADSLRRPLIPHRESASGLVQEYGVFQSREDSSDSLGGATTFRGRSATMSRERIAKHLETLLWRLVRFGDGLS